MLRSLTTAASVLMALTGASAAAELRDGEVYLIEQFEGLSLGFQVESWPGDAQGVTLAVSPPAVLTSKTRDGESVNALLVEFGSKVPGVNLGKMFKTVVDGIYGYEISVGTSKQIKKDEKMDNGRDKDRDYDLLSYTVSGHFVIDGGSIVVFKQDPEVGVEPTVPGKPVDDGDTG